MSAIRRLVLLNQMAGPLFRQLAEDLSSHFPGGCLLVTGHPDTVGMAKQLNPHLQVCPAPVYDRSSQVSRVISWFRYVFTTTFYILGARKGDAILLVSNPPLLGPWVWLLTRMRRVPYVVLVYDIHPDVLVNLGVIGHDSPVAVLWRWMNRRVYRGARAVITIGRRMAIVLGRQLGSSDRRVAMVPPWVDIGFIKPLCRADNPHAKKFLSRDGLVLLYSGNMGASHDIDSMLEAALQLRDRQDINFLFIGEGEKRADAERFVAQHALENVRVFPFQPEDMLPYTLPLADISLVALDEGMEDLMVPSKTYSYLAAGSAVIAITNPNSELVDIVEGNACGCCVSPQQPNQLADTILSLAENRERLALFRKNAREAAQNFYSRGAGVNEFVRILDEAALMPSTHCDLSERRHHA